MRGSGFVLLAGLLAASCSHRAPTAANSISTVMRRQVANAVDMGDGDYAGRVLRQRLAANPDNLDLRLELARHYQELGYPELALEHARFAAARFPDSGEARITMAKALRALDLRQEAVRTMEGFLASHPRAKADLYSWLGILLDELGRMQAAEKAHRTAVAREPGNDALHNNLGYNLLLQGREEAAAGEFRAALKLRPGSTLARNNLGLALASNPKEAVLHLESVSDPATAHSNLAAALMEHGRYAEARKELEAALGYNRNHPAALSNLRLLAQLDGKPAAIPASRAARPLWRRVAADVWNFLRVRQEPPRGKGAVQAASR